MKFYSNLAGNWIDLITTAPQNICINTVKKYYKNDFLFILVTEIFQNTYPAKTGLDIIAGSASVLVCSLA